MEVNPENGVWVDMEGIMEVRFYENEYDEDNYETQDMFEFQQYEGGHIPDDYCHKDRDTGAQNVFYCIVCACDLKSVIPLKAHIMGKKHISKALEKKKKTWGIETEPQNAPKKKRANPPKAKIDINMTLEERMRESCEPFLGLFAITEYRNPRNSSDPPFYTCSLAGCKSAWGNSDDMFNHVKQLKHTRNLLKSVFQDQAELIEKLNKNEVFKKANDYAEDEGFADPDTRRYDDIDQVADAKMYEELKKRPHNWTESQDNLKRKNTNFEPLGSNKRSKAQESKDGLKFAPMWYDKPFDWEAFHQEHLKCYRKNMDRLKEKIDSFEGEEGDDKYNNIWEILEEDLFCLNLLKNEMDGEDDKQYVQAMSKLLEEAKGLERQMKDKINPTTVINKKLTDLDKDMSNGAFSLEDIKGRLVDVTSRLSSLENEDISLRDAFRERLDKLWELFHQRKSGKPEQSPSENSETAQEARAKYTALFTAEVSSLVDSELRMVMAGESEAAIKSLAQKILDKLLTNEEQSFLKKGLPWADFVVTEKSRKRMKTFIAAYAKAKSKSKSK